MRRTSPTRGLGPRLSVEGKRRTGDPKRFRPAGTESPIRYSPPPAGEQRKLRRLPGEGSAAASQRARLMGWWPRVQSKSRAPSSTAIWWIWIVEPNR